jgi:hypothetical protein
LLADRLAAYFRQQNDALDFRIDPRVFHDAVAAVYLAGKADVLFEAFARSSWPEELEPWLHGFCDLACRAFGGRSPGSASVPDPLPEVPKPLGAVAALLRVMSENEAQRFEGALVHFVTRAWGPGAEKGAKADLKSRWPLYTGRWSILAAAACRRMRITPDLPPKAQVYFPRELL